MKTSFLWQDAGSGGGGCPSLSRIAVAPEGYIVAGKKVSEETLAQIPQVADEEVAVFVPGERPRSSPEGM